ncbi:hypothetical protein C8Q80DRAFT_73379 [Daedaleopsis nitida]|nr:hypothetical protein C8Q80DRAFT_73379 [Daedaleopsis nitida]
MISRTSMGLSLRGALESPGCLSVCGLAARTIAAATTNKPLVGVHHTVSLSSGLCPLPLSLHLSRHPSFSASPRAHPPPSPSHLTLSPPSRSSPSSSGGSHTLLLLATSRTAFRILPTTLDESIGNAYDKVAKLLRIPYANCAPGATLKHFCADTPSSDRAMDDQDRTNEGKADQAIPEVLMPRPMRGRLAFSYTGLHSTVGRFLDARRGTLDVHTRFGLARSFQRSAVAQLEEKLTLGMQLCAR